MISEQKNLKPGTQSHWLLTELHGGRRHTPRSAALEGGVMALHSLVSHLKARHGIIVHRERVEVSVRGGRRAWVNEVYLPPESPAWRQADELLRGCC